MNFFVGVIVNNLQAVEIEERDDIAEIRKALARVEAQLQSSRDAEASEERSKTDQRHPKRVLLGRFCVLSETQPSEAHRDPKVATRCSSQTSSLASRHKSSGLVNRQLNHRF